MEIMHPRLLSEMVDVTLSPEQEEVLRLVKSGKSVFFTGPAGTGKSLLLRKIINILRPWFDTVDGVAITASTGIAGLNIGGRTIHSFAGVRSSKEPLDISLENITESIKLTKRWQTTRVLIIDEISMIDAIFFDKLEKIARIIRHNSAPFGGLQLVLCGDFYQLPPVAERSHRFIRQPSYAFSAKSWEKCIPHLIFLKKVFRQTDDAFISLLSNMRLGSLTPGDIECLRALSRPLYHADGDEPTELFPCNYEVDSCNILKLKALPGPECVYHAMDSAGYDITGLPIIHEEVEELLRKIVGTPVVVRLKIGAKVMLTKNILEGRLVNGSIGFVSAYMTLTDAERERKKIQKLENDEYFVIPERTGRQSSKIKEISFLGVSNDEMRPLTGHIFSSRDAWPVVNFKNGKLKLICTPQEFTIDGPKANLEARRIQVPLILAWAMTIHKSQGQTLHRVKMNLSKVFAPGQAYVAVSRASSMEGLELHNLDPSKVTADKRVIQWHDGEY